MQAISIKRKADSTLSTIDKKHKPNNYLPAIPDELILSIFSHLSENDMAGLLSTCSRWNDKPITYLFPKIKFMDLKTLSLEMEQKAILFSKPRSYIIKKIHNLFSAFNLDKDLAFLTLPKGWSTSKLMQLISMPPLADSFKFKLSDHFSSIEKLASYIGEQPLEEEQNILLTPYSLSSNNNYHDIKPFIEELGWKQSEFLATCTLFVSMHLNKEANFPNKVVFEGFTKMISGFGNWTYESKYGWNLALAQGNYIYDPLNYEAETGFDLENWDLLAQLDI